VETPPEKKVKERIAVNGFPSHISLAIWDHTVLPATRHKWTRPTSTPASKLVLDLPTPERWKAELHPAMHRPRFELAIFRSRVWRPTTIQLSQPVPPVGGLTYAQGPHVTNEFFCRFLMFSKYLWRYSCIMRSIDRPRPGVVTYLTFEFLILACSTYTHSAHCVWKCTVNFS